jgi:hypothetical protein
MCAQDRGRREKRQYGQSIQAVFPRKGEKAAWKAQKDEEFRDSDLRRVREAHYTMGLVSGLPHVTS